MIKQKQEKRISTLLREYFAEESSFENRRLTETAVPISPNVCTWEVHKSPERFSRKFMFSDKHAVKNFISECLSYEIENNHSGEYKINDLEVTVEVYTHDINRITELDQEFTKQVDFIYKDVLSFGRY